MGKNRYAPLMMFIAAIIFFIVAVIFLLNGPEGSQNLMD